MIITRRDIVNEARTWVGTPFQHQMREKGVGCDCIGHVLGIGWAFGITEFDTTNYTPGSADSKEIVNTLDKLTIRISVRDIKMGDIVCLSFLGQPPTHIGILTDYREGMLGIVHAMTSMKMVKEHRLSSDWRKKIVRAYMYPGVID